jgi:hypothetical protein
VWYLRKCCATPWVPPLVIEMMLMYCACPPTWPQGLDISATFHCFYDVNLCPTASIIEVFWIPLDTGTPHILSPNHCHHMCLCQGIGTEESLKSTFIHKTRHPHPPHGHPQNNPPHRRRFHLPWPREDVGNRFPLCEG